MGDLINGGQFPKNPNTGISGPRRPIGGMGGQGPVTIPPGATPIGAGVAAPGLPQPVTTPFQPGVSMPAPQPQPAPVGYDMGPVGGDMPQPGGPAGGLKEPGSPPPTYPGPGDGSGMPKWPGGAPPAGPVGAPQLPPVPRPRQALPQKPQPGGNMGGPPQSLPKLPMPRPRRPLG